uniref:Uncharacterized protein n=1 Tax=uncultured prokaryote TaxID=198431 RepID=A0A0H5Q5K5_9ZZZZ|nr:hypothetical protein [uncultured prokaryote]
MDKLKEVLRGRIEEALDEGFAKHIPLTSDYLAEKLMGVMPEDCGEAEVVKRIVAASVIDARVAVDKNVILDGEPVSDFDKFVAEQDEAMELAAKMLRDPVPMLTPTELRKAYEIQQNNYDVSDILNELDCASEDYPHSDFH